MVVIVYNFTIHEAVLRLKLTVGSTWGRCGGEKVKRKKR